MDSIRSRGQRYAFFFPFVSLIDRSRSSQSGELCVQANAFASMSSHLTKRRYRRSFLSFFFSSSDRTVSRRTVSFSTLTSIPVRRQREVCASLRIVVSPHCQSLTSLALPRLVSSRLVSHHPPPRPAYVLPTHQSGRMSLPIPKCGPPSPTRTTWRCPSIPFARGRLGSYGRSSYPVSTSFSIFDTQASASVRFVLLFFSSFFFCLS
jgi:hypothetical protein